MVRVQDEITIRGPIDKVFRCFWDAELWPVLTPHVKRIEMIERSPSSQRFLMTVESNGKSHTLETRRSADNNRRITYVQSRPPAFLRHHRGEWTFSVEGSDVRVRLLHEAVIDESKLELLDAEDLQGAEATVARNLSANGRLTMSAVKAHVES
jgi:uncharacterized protein YndB with AHSA1/START domain